MADEVYTEAQLNRMLDKIRTFSREEAEFEASEANRLLGLKISNAEKLHNLQVKQAQDAADAELRAKQAINEKLIKMGFDANSVINEQNLKDRLKAVDTEKRAALAAAGGDKDKIKAINKEYKERTQKEKDLEKIRSQMRQASYKEAAKAAKEEYKNLGDIFAGGLTGADANARAKLKEMHPEWSDEQVNAQANAAKAGAAIDAMANFAKQLESTMKDVAYAQGAIDTRMQGSGQRKWLGSYWKAMNQDVIAHVGMSPFVKQADVVNNLKTLVGKGIAFNVEQRAFLDTISDKIATTFEATDATLLKLVRIQQADTTAARLGMESALTAFLNSMYETTEYMTEAAADIRASIYEASSLMGAAEATAFEYQVQKWMGSLYSVGFSNTSGLAGSLGKLAAGDISGITDGGYGNLLIMAANRAGISIADVLANGLDDSETNELMKSMVEYLQQIYVETKNSKVVAQQFANVYGLTASDLKAAANLYGSTKNIAGSNLNYGGMINRLQSMASSMFMRTSMGEMMENLFGNLKFATASTMGNSPTLYAIYTIASMLDDTVGGINIPAFSVMGNMVDLETTVSNLMRAASLGGGLLGGIGTMVAGLFGGSGTGLGMLRGFGVNGNLTTLSRGSGTGISAISGATVSESGYVGNSEGGDVQNKTMQDANEEGKSQLAEAQDESTETKLSTVDEHIIDIYNLLQDVVDGTSNLHVEIGNASAWADIMSGRG